MTRNNCPPYIGYEMFQWSCDMCQHAVGNGMLSTKSSYSTPENKWEAFAHACIHSQDSQNSQVGWERPAVSVGNSWITHWGRCWSLQLQKVQDRFWYICVWTNPTHMWFLYRLFSGARYWIWTEKHASLKQEHGYKRASHGRTNNRRGPDNIGPSRAVLRWSRLHAQMTLSWWSTPYSELRRHCPMPGIHKLVTYHTPVVRNSV